MTNNEKLMQHEGPTPSEQYAFERGYQRALQVIRETPQREWQGLTDEEMKAIDPDGFNEGIPQQIEAKLKEKNSG